jgi:hypothetical protein
VDWIHLAQNRDQWRAVGNTVMCLRSHMASVHVFHCPNRSKLPATGEVPRFRILYNNRVRNMTVWVLGTNCYNRYLGKAVMGFSAVCMTIKPLPPTSG